MNWKKIGCVAIVIILIAGLVLYTITIPSTSIGTPPPYSFYWRLSILDENKSTVTLEIRDIEIYAINTETEKKWVDVTNKTKIPLCSIVYVGNDNPVPYPFNSSSFLYEDVDNDSAVSTGDRMILNRSEIHMDNYSKLSCFSIITGYPWEKLTYRYGVVGSDTAIAKIPPPYVRVTPEVLHKVYDYEDHCWQVGGDDPYYVWALENKYW